MIVFVRGAGDIATGVALRLHRSGMKIIMSDLPIPTSIRRTVCFSEAIRLGEYVVEDVKGKFAKTAEEAISIVNEGFIAVMADEKAKAIKDIKPDVVIDSILAKRNLGTKIDDADIVIGVGPGFCAGKDCHAVIETKRGHTMGRVIYKGEPIPDTGIPGNIEGFTGERVMRAPDSGVFETCHEIGDLVKAGEACGYVNGKPMKAKIDGMVRGLLQDGVSVFEGMKSGDVDPRGKRANYTLSSEKALAVGGGALEAILNFSGVLR